MNILYFFIKDYAKGKKIEIKYCPTEDMVADIHTKPFQGRNVRKLQAKLMNYPIDLPYETDTETIMSYPSSKNTDKPQECVAESPKPSYQDFLID